MQLGIITAIRDIQIIYETWDTYMVHGTITETMDITKREKKKST
jgi:hypothetical protein